MSVWSSPVTARGLETTAAVNLTVRNSILGDARTGIHQDLEVVR